MDKKRAAVVGGGIVGLAMARALALKGFSVHVFERNEKACGASIRNFGMIFPTSQPEGKWYRRAKRSRDIWESFCKETHTWYHPGGTLHIAREADEWQVLQEVHAVFNEEGRQNRLLKKDSVGAVSPAVISSGLLGAMHCMDDLVVDPRRAMHALPVWLHEKFKVQTHFNTCITAISGGKLFAGRKEILSADLVFVCNGSDFETLYPDEYAMQPLTRCKLQMMRFKNPVEHKPIGPALCGGLSLLHYGSFKKAPSLQLLKKRVEEELPEYIKYGIHVMATQNEQGEFTIGDSHEYGRTPDPFDKDQINILILDYLRRFVDITGFQLRESWHGIYPKLTNGETDLVLSPEPGVLIVNALSGAGMTLSFGLAEELSDAF